MNTDFTDDDTGTRTLATYKETHNGLLLTIKLVSVVVLRSQFYVAFIRIGDSKPKMITITRDGLRCLKIKCGHEDDILKAFETLVDKTAAMVDAGGNMDLFSRPNTSHLN